MSRDEFLGKLRERLAVPAPENLPHPLHEFREVPRIDYERSLQNPVSAFAEAAESVGTKVRTITEESHLTSLLDELVRAHSVEAAVVSKDPETVGTLQRLVALGVEVLPFESFHNPARAGLGITGAQWGIAATGTLVLNAARAGGRSSGLLPPVHLALVRAERILPEAGELFRRMPERMPGGLPSQMVLATGPSRSGDIELEITIGVHGPREVWVGILDMT